MAFVLDRFSETWWPDVREALMHPRTLFAGLERIAFYKDPVMYSLTICLLSSVIAFPFIDVSAMFFFPVYAGIWLAVQWLWSSYLAHAAQRAGSWLTTVNAFQLTAYAGTPLMFFAIPWFNIVAGIWALYLCWLGLVEFAKVPPKKALWIVALPGVFVWLPLFVLAAKVFAFLPKLPAILGGQQGA